MPISAWRSQCGDRIIVSIPVDVTGEEEYAKLEEKGVKGRYASVERLQELDNPTHGICSKRGKGKVHDDLQVIHEQEQDFQSS